jgi:hypothetical protein
MPIKNVTVDWMERYANAPTFHVTMDCPLPSWPSEDDPVWTRYPNGIHVAEDKDIVFYFFTDGKPTEGFGGRRFVGTFRNGGGFSYRGAWSSCASVVNATAGGPAIVDVVIGNIATAVYWSDMVEWCRKNPSCGFGLIAIKERNGETILLPTRNGKLKNELSKSHQATRII